MRWVWAANELSTQFRRCEARLDFLSGVVQEKVGLRGRIWGMKYRDPLARRSEQV